MIDIYNEKGHEALSSCGDQSQKGPQDLQSCVKFDFNDPWVLVTCHRDHDLEVAFALQITS